MESHIWDPTLETIKRSDLENIQLQRLKDVVKKVYEKNIYYHRKMKEVGLKPDDIKALSDLRKLPFTTKDDLREMYPYGSLVVDISEVVEVHGSSGTTGKPTLSFYTKRDIENWSELMARSLTAIGVTKNDIIFIAYNYHMFTGGFGFHYGALKIGAMAIPAGVGYSQRQVTMIKDLGVTMITSVPNYALRLAEAAYEMGIDPAKDTKVRKGVFGAEMWSDSLRRKIESIWNMESFDIYGMAELYGPGTAIDCQYHNGLHVWEDHYIVEVVDPKTGDVLEPEEKGELVITTLTKDAVPLIRYRTRDISRILDIKTCDCGRTHIKIDRIQGRTDDMFIINGVNVWPSAIELILMKHPFVGNEYQVIVKKSINEDKILIKIESSRKLDRCEREAVVKKLQCELKETILVTPEIEIVDPGTLPRSEGKAKRIVIESEGI